MSKKQTRSWAPTEKPRDAAIFVSALEMQTLCCY